MNREEAIEVYNGLINTKIKEAFEFFAPELRKINEEEIRKDIIGGLMWQRDNLKSEGPHDNNLILPGFCLTVGKHLAYLERQKEQPISAEEVLARAGLKPYKDGNQWCILAGDNIQEGICGFGDTIEDALYEFLKEVLDLQKKQNEYISLQPIIYTEQGEVLAEQEPISTEDMPYVTDEHFFEQEPADSFKYKLAEYMTKNCTKKESPYEYSYSINSESILEMAKEELIKRGELQKPVAFEGVNGVPCPYGNQVVDLSPVEWSEEDEKIMDSIINELGQHYKTCTSRDCPSASFSFKAYQKEMDWLKSLRPQWKPTEEQMEAMEFVIKDYREDGCIATANYLQEILDQIKKL